MPHGKVKRKVKARSRRAQRMKARRKKQVG